MPQPCALPPVFRIAPSLFVSADLAASWASLLRCTRKPEASGSSKQKEETYRSKSPLDSDAKSGDQMSTSFFFNSTSPSRMLVMAMTPLLK